MAAERSVSSISSAPSGLPHQRGSERHLTLHPHLHRAGSPSALQLLLPVLRRNHLMWTTGGAVLLSLLGTKDRLDPDSRTAVPQLSFVDGSLAWFAGCCVPLTLFSTGMWMHGRPLTSASNLAATLAYTTLRMFVLPCVMVFVNWLLGISGRLAYALVLLSCVPVAQTAFVVSEQYKAGTEAVTSVLSVGLLLMLPHLLLVLAVMKRLGLYSSADGTHW